jgi:hypothetical protein
VEGTFPVFVLTVNVVLEITLMVCETPVILFVATNVPEVLVTLLMLDTVPPTVMVCPTLGVGVGTLVGGGPTGVVAVGCLVPLPPPAVACAVAVACDVVDVEVEVADWPDPLELEFAVRALVVWTTFASLTVRAASTALVPPMRIVPMSAMATLVLKKLDEPFAILTPPPTLYVVLQEVILGAVDETKIKRGREFLYRFEQASCQCPMSLETCVARQELSG